MLGKVTKSGGNWLKNKKVTGKKTYWGVENTPFITYRVKVTVNGLFNSFGKWNEPSKAMFTLYRIDNRSTLKTIPDRPAVHT